MSRSAVARLFTTGVVISTSTAVRAGLRGLGVVTSATPSIVRRAVDAAFGDRTELAITELRDDLIGVFRRTAEASWHEMRRGIDDLEAFTRPEGDESRAPGRPYRVKP